MSPNPAYLVSFCRKEIRVDRQTDRLHRQTDRQAGCTHRGNAMWGHGKKTVICKPGRETPGETQPADTLVLDFQPLELSEIKFLLLKPEICSFFSSWQPEQTSRVALKPHAKSASISVFRVPEWPCGWESYFHPAHPPALFCAFPVWESFLYSGANC